MRADISEGAGPRLLGAEPPTPWRAVRHRPILEIKRAEAQDFADRPLFDQFLGFQDRRTAAIVEAYHVRTLRAAGLLGHLPRVPGAEGKRLFAEHVLALGHRELGDRPVRVVGGYDVDNVDVRAGDRLFPIHRPFIVAELMRASLGEFLSDIDDNLASHGRQIGKEGRQGRQGEALQPSHHTSPDQRDAQSSHKPSSLLSVPFEGANPGATISQLPSTDAKILGLPWQKLRLIV